MNRSRAIVLLSGGLDSATTLLIARDLGFDVFALSKLLWTMISGKPRMQLWYWNDPRFDLTIQFPEDAHVARVNRIVSKTLVQFAIDCLPTATELLSEVDEAIDAIETSTQLPSTSKPMRCRFCGIGTYEQFSGIQADGLEIAVSTARLPS